MKTSCYIKPNAIQEKQCYVQRNNEGISLKQYCCEKAISMKYYECVFVVLVVQGAKPMHRIIFSSVAYLALPYFFHNFSKKRHDFRKSVILQQLCFDFLYNFQVPVTVRRKRSVKRDKNNKMQQSDVYYQLLSQHVSGIIMPIFRRTKTALLHMVYCFGSAGCGWQRQLHGLCSPVDGHNDARNMLRQKLIINI